MILNYIYASQKFESTKPTHYPSLSDFPLLTNSLWYTTHNLSWLIFITTVLIIYNITTSLIFMTLLQHPIVNLKSSSLWGGNHVVLNFVLVLFYANLVGLPGTPGFLLKVFLLLKQVDLFNPVWGLLFTIINFTAFYLYIPFCRYLAPYAATRVHNLNHLGGLRQAIILLMCFIFNLPLITLLFNIII